MANLGAIQSFALKQPITKDTKFNKGRKDCIEGNIYTDDAKYFLQCATYCAEDEGGRYQ